MTMRKEGAFVAQDAEGNEITIFTYRVTVDASYHGGRPALKSREIFPPTERVTVGP
jgi:hypothetical protein